MKCRSGFVSNSSSSSFVIYGANIPEQELSKTRFLKEVVGIQNPKVPSDFEDEWEYNDYFYNEAYDFCSKGDSYFGFSEEDGSENGCVLIGVKIAEGDEFNNIGENSVSISKLDEDFSKLKNKLGLTEEIKTKIIVGSRCC